MSAPEDWILTAGLEGGPTLLFLHGGGGNAAMWLPQFERLQSEFRLIAPDLPGHGRSDLERFQFDAAVDAAEAVLDHDQNVVVVGLSLGGYIAIGLAHRRPELLSGLVLSGSSIDYRGWDGFTTKAYGLLVPPLSRWLDRKAGDALRDIAPSETAEAIIDRGLSVKGVGQALRRLPGRDFPGMLASYPGPTLLLNGERDSQNVKAAPQMAAAAQHSSIHVIEDAGHACSLSQPDAFTEAVRAFVGSVVDVDRSGTKERDR